MYAILESLIEVPYVDPSFLGSHNVKSLSPWSHCIRLNNMNNVMCYMNNDMCYVKYVMCCLQNDMYDDACYSLSMTFLIRFGKSTDLTFDNSYH